MARTWRPAFFALAALAALARGADLGSGSAAPAPSAAAAASPPFSASAGPRLLEVTPRTFDRVLDGRRVVVVAFVNPLLPRSGAMHAVLHALHAGFAARNATLAVAYADVHQHRAFVRRFALKSVPTLLAFPRGPNLAHAPVTIPFLDNKTAADYRRDIEIFAARCDGLASAPPELAALAGELVGAVLVRETAEVRLSQARAAAARAAAAAAAAQDETAAANASHASEAAGASVAADGSSISGNGSITTNRSSADVLKAPAEDSAEAECASLRNRSAVLLRELDAEIGAQLDILAARREKLELLRVLAAGVEANGTSSLAHHMNVERARSLVQAASVPLELELVGKEAEQRLSKLARISLLVDLFESLGGAD